MAAPKTLVLAVLSLLITAGQVSAQPACEGRGEGAPKRLSAREIRQCVAGMFRIQYAVMTGDDVSAALESLEGFDGPLRISNSVIEGGLSFVRSPAKRISSLAPETRARLNKIAPTHDNDPVFVVDRKIELRQVRILAGAAYDPDDFSAVAFGGRNYLFLRPVDFTGSTFVGSAQFGRAVFIDDVVFNGVSFERRASFDSVSFGGRASFREVRFAGPALFTYVRVAGDAQFRGVQFQRAPLFDKSRFCGEVHFGGADFGGGARFVGVRAARGINLLDANFPFGADFSAVDAAAVKLERFRGAGTITLSSANIGQLSVGSATHLRVDAEMDVTGSTIGELVITDVGFGRPVSFARTRFGKVPPGDAFKNDTSEARMVESAARIGCPVTVVSKSDRPQASGVALADAAFAGGVSFQDGLFTGPVSLRDVTFSGRADFRGASFERQNGPFLKILRLDVQKIDIDWPAVPGFSDFVVGSDSLLPSEVYEDLSEAYKARGNIQASLSARRRAGWAVASEARACLNAGSAVPKGKASAFCQPGEAWPTVLFHAFIYPGWGLTSGFSTSLAQLVLVIVAVNLLFALIYHRYGMLLRVVPPDGKRQSIRVQPLTHPRTFMAAERSRGRVTRVRGFRDALALSTAVLLRYGRGDAAIKGNWGRVDLAHIVALEWVAGIALGVDLIKTLTETQPFIQRLLSGLL